jgi:phosphoglycerate dehydrogenase-like enzyme
MRKLIAFVVAVAMAAVVGFSQVKIVVTELGPAEIRQIQAAAPGATILAGERATLATQVADADAIVGTINPELFRAAKKLRWVQVYSAGIEHYVFPELADSGVVLTNCKILQGPNIADHAMSLLLALTRELYLTIPNRVSEEWNRREYSPVELRGKTAVIVGVGGIGMQIAQRAHAFDMTVIGVDPKDMPLNYFVSRVVPPDRLETVLPEADVVFMAAPLTPESQTMMGRRQFGLMKKGSYFIAVSRGRTYDSDALLEALQSKRLAGAGLDVTNPEPLPKGNPLWKLENVIITPHIAGQSDGVEARRMALIVENVSRFVRGERLLNVVDKKKGY